MVPWCTFIEKDWTHATLATNEEKPLITAKETGVKMTKHSQFKAYNINRRLICIEITHHGSTNPKKEIFSFSIF